MSKNDISPPSKGKPLITENMREDAQSMEHVPLPELEMGTNDSIPIDKIVSGAIHDIEKHAKFGLGIIRAGLKINDYIEEEEEEEKGLVGIICRMDSVRRTHSQIEYDHVLAQMNDTTLVDQADIDIARGAYSVESEDQTATHLRRYHSGVCSDIDQIFGLSDSVAPESRGQVDELSFFTFNAGLLQYTLFGVPFWENPSHVHKRAQYLPVAMRNICSDFIALQEVFREVDANLIKDHLRLIYPFHARYQSGGIIKMHNGLMVLSKFPIISTVFHPFSQGTLLECYFASKGFLEVKVSIPEIGYIILINFHLASAAAEPESTYVEKIRNYQIDEILSVVQKAESEGNMCVLMGDLNASPDSSPSNYYRFLNFGLQDAFLQATVGIGKPEPSNWYVEDQDTDSSPNEASPANIYKNKALRIAERNFTTWDPRNPLNLLGPHADCEGSRCDHIFIRKKNLSNSNIGFKPVEGKIKFKAPRVLLENRFGKCRLCTLSDHYGVYVRVSKANLS